MKGKMLGSQFIISIEDIKDRTKTVVSQETREEQVRVG